MRKTIYYSSIIAITLASVSCRSNDKEVVDERNERGVPLAIAKSIMGNSYSLDTLFSSPEIYYIYVNNPDYNQNIIYGNEGMIFNSPTARLDSISPSRYVVRDLLKSVDVEFSQPESVGSLKDAFPIYPEFSIVALGDTSTTGQKAIFAYAVDDPSDKLVHSSKVKAWVEKCIDDTLAFNENIQAIGSVLETAFLGEYPERESDFTYLYSRSLLAYVMTSDYVTYHDYFNVFRGGAHGMYGNRFISYDLKKNIPVSYNSLFKSGIEIEDQVRELIYEAIAADDDFMTSHHITSLSQLKTYFSDYLNGEPISIGDLGLLPTGVIFSYQPYEIAPYADGNIFAIISFDKLEDLLK